MIWTRVRSMVLGLAGIVVSTIILYLGRKEAPLLGEYGDPLYLFTTVLTIDSVTLIGLLCWGLPVNFLTLQPPLLGTRSSTTLSLPLSPAISLP